MVCAFRIEQDDILDTVSRAGHGECSIKNAICEEWSQRKNLVGTTDGRGFEVPNGAPDKMIKISCEPVPTTQVGACGLIPKSTDPSCRGTLGGPLTYYFDKKSDQCVAYQNLGSCHARGPFAALSECFDAKSKKKCD